MISAARPGAPPEGLEHVFADVALCEHALTHRSWCAENPDHESNERLEFLGDSVLGLVVTDHLYERYPDLAEGELAKIRAAVVSASTLADVARALDLGAGLRLGRGEEQSGGREKSSILADGLEALIGAVYLDAGLDAARTMVLGLLADQIVDAATGPGRMDYKTRLQELAVGRFDTLPVYEVQAEGPDHRKEFSAEVFISGRRFGAGRGTSKKEAEQAAATDAFTNLAATTRDSAGAG